MKLAFCLFNYFPYGGLQRDFLRILRVCRDRGHEIHVFTARWEGKQEPGITLHLLPTRGWQNHVKAASFAKACKSEIAQGQFDLTVGFNKMPHLDIYYAADVCYVARIHEDRSKLYTLLPRYRQWAALENAVFAKSLPTHIFLISAKQQEHYTQYYQTEANRFHLLPPGIDKDRLRTDAAITTRQNLRSKHKIADDKIILLMIGSGFKTKGVDRSIRALASLPDNVRARLELWVIGKDEPGAFLALAKTLKISEKVSFLGAKDDVPAYLLAADLLLHPSYHENTGTVILEALAAGLPVLTVAACGYAFYVEKANAGKVLPAPFKQQDWNQLLLNLITQNQLKQLGENGFQFAKNADIYDLPKKAADLIEEIGRARAVIS